MSNSLTKPPLLAVSHAKLMQRALKEIKQIKADRAEWEEDRRTNGWTSRNPYCVHGTYIGDPYGADYMCGACEDGMTDHEWAVGNAHSAAWRAQQRHQQAVLWITLHSLALDKALDKGDPIGIKQALFSIEENLGIIREIEKEWA